MALKQRLQQLKTQWHGSPPRDQRLLALGAFLLISLALYWLIIAPWITLQNKLDNALPRLRNDLASMTQMAQEQARLTSTQATPSDRQQLAAELLRQFPAPNAVLTNDGSERLQLSIKQADFDDLLARLAGLQQQHPIQISSAKFTRLANATQVQAELVFALPPPP